LLPNPQLLRIRKRFAQFARPYQAAKPEIARSMAGENRFHDAGGAAPTITVVAAEPRTMHAISV
jgi:hypothetical protein